MNRLLDLKISYWSLVITQWLMVILTLININKDINVLLSLIIMILIAGLGCFISEKIFELKESKNGI